MGHRQQMNSKQLLEWDSMQYKARLEAQRGHNYQYYTESLSKQLFLKGYNWYKFSDDGIKNSFAITSESKAKEIVKKLKSENHYARIIVGYSQNTQRIKMYSIVYRKKS